MERNLSAKTKGIGLPRRRMHAENRLHFIGRVKAVPLVLLVIVVVIVCVHHLAVLTIFRVGRSITSAIEVKHRPFQSVAAGIKIPELPSVCVVRITFAALRCPQLEPFGIAGISVPAVSVCLSNGHSIGEMAEGRLSVDIPFECDRPA
jgi:hypothetical protein